MRVDVTFEIHPPGVFGVPDGHKTVIPAADGRIEGHGIHMKAGVRTSYGSLSKYRDPAEALSTELELRNSRIRIHDNFVFSQVEVADARDGLFVAARDLSRLLQHLSISQGHLFSFKPTIVETEDRELLPFPTQTQTLSVAMFNLVKLKEQTDEAATFQALDNDRLNKALDYYEHGRYLMESRTLTPHSSGQDAFILSSAFLHFWKSITAVVGDPSRRSDRYQSRFRRFGLEQEEKTKIDDLKRVRDGFDVAHYSVDPGTGQRVVQEIGKAQAMARRVIDVYRRFLLEDTAGEINGGT